MASAASQSGTLVTNRPYIQAVTLPAELEAGDTETVANEDHERAVCLVAAQALARRRAGCEFVVDGYPDEGERTETLKLST